MNKKTLILSAIAIIILLGAALYFYYSPQYKGVMSFANPNTATQYSNTEFGFSFSLPATWDGYSVISGTWAGIPLKSSTNQNGTKLLIRNPKWTTSLPYEDLPILIFTVAQWNSYLNEEFSVSAAPILASELARNNKYVFALPPRWNLDFSEGHIEAEEIILKKPLTAFDLK